MSTELNKQIDELEVRIDRILESPGRDLTELETLVREHGMLVTELGVQALANLRNKQ